MNLGGTTAWNRFRQNTRMIIRGQRGWVAKGRTVRKMPAVPDWPYPRLAMLAFWVRYFRARTFR